MGNAKEKDADLLFLISANTAGKQSSGGSLTGTFQEAPELGGRTPECIGFSQEQLLKSGKQNLPLFLFFYLFA